MGEVARAGRARAAAPREPLEVAATGEPVAQRRPQLHGVDELLDGVEPLSDPRRLEQRVEDPLAQTACAHRRFRLVEHPEERPAALPAERLEELEVPPRGPVEAEEAG